jgi:hypothetical protein
VFARGRDTWASSSLARHADAGSTLDLVVTYAVVADAGSTLDLGDVVLPK